MIREWNPRTGAPMRTFPDVVAGSDPDALALSPDGTTLYTNSGINSVTAWDVRTGGFAGRLVQGPRTQSSVGYPDTALAVSRDGRTEVAVDQAGTVMRWRTTANWLRGPSDPVESVAFSPDGKEISAGDANSSLFAWSTTTGGQTGETNDAPDGVLDIRYTPDGTQITGTGNATFTATAPGSGSDLPVSVVRPGSVFLGQGTMALSPDGRWLAAALRQPDASGQDGYTIDVWDTATFAEHAVLDLGQRQPAALTFSPDGSRLLALTGSGGGGVISDGLIGSSPNDSAGAAMTTWRTSDFTGGTQIALGNQTLNAAVYTPDGKTLITGGTTGTVQIRDAATGRVREEFGSHPSAVRRLAISPDGRTLATITAEDATIRLWDLADPHHPLIAALTSDYAVNDIVFSPDGSRLASGGGGIGVALWNLDPATALRAACRNLADAGPQDLDGTGCA
jgi:WD40 repeat protein